MSYKDAEILADSRLGLQLKDTPALTEGFEILKAEKRMYDEAKKQFEATVDSPLGYKKPNRSLIFKMSFNKVEMEIINEMLIPPEEKENKNEVRQRTISDSLEKE